MTSADPFIGRGSELARLFAAAGGDPSSPRTFLVGGEAGVGKTRLVEELMLRSDPSDVAFGRGACIHTAHSSLPFVAVTQALEALLERYDAEAIVPIIERLPELARVLPHVVADPGPSQDRGGGLTYEWAATEPSQLPVFHAVGSLLLALGELRPAGIVLDDLHWADPSTRDLVVYLAERLVGSATTLIGIYRSDEMHRGHPLRDVIAELDRRPTVGHLLVEPFDLAELRDLANARLGRPPSSRTLTDVAERSQGNAFFAGELLDAIARGTDSLRPELTSLILSRVDALSTSTRELLRTLAVGGESARDELLEAVSDLTADDLTAALREAIEQQVITASDDGALRFRHALVQEAVYSTLLPRERRRAHAAYARALEERPELGAVRGGSPAELAWHLRESRQFERAIPAYLRGADDAESKLAYSEALAQLEGALELWDDADDAAELSGVSRAALLRRTASVAYASGDPLRATIMQGAAIDDSGELTPTELGLLYARLGRYTWASGRTDEAIAAYRRSADLVPETPLTRERAWVLAGLGQILMLTGDNDEAEGELVRAIEIARATGATRAEGHALNSLGTVMSHGGRSAEGFRMLDDALAIAEAAGDSEEQLRVYVNRSSGMVAAGHLRDAEHLSYRGLEVARRFGDEGAMGFFISSNLADALRELGRWEESEAATHDARQPEGPLSRTWTLASAVSLAVGRGQLDVAQELMDEVDPETLRTIEPQMMHVYWQRLADLHAANGSIDRARHAIRHGLDQATTTATALALRVVELALDAETALGAGADVDAAEVQARSDDVEALIAARVPDLDTEPRINALLAEARAQTATALGQPDVDPWRAAVAAYRAPGYAYDVVRAQLALGRALLQAGDRPEATAVLQDAADAAGRLGAHRLDAEARRLLDHAGLTRPTSADDDEPASASTTLTDRELDVLKLVADGRTNRQIGEQLFISAKTASVHVSRILAKLGVDNRTEAAAAARRAGLV